MPSPEDFVAQVLADVAKYPKGTLRIFRLRQFVASGKVSDHREADKRVHAQILRAVKQGYMIEAIALRAQAIDMWLRIYICTGLPRVSAGCGAGEAEVTPRYRDLDESCVPPIQRSLRDLVDLCCKRAMDSQLIERLKAYVENRNLAIHRYIAGHVRYEDFAATVWEGEVLYVDLLKYVTKNFGDPINDEDDIWGSYSAADMILNTVLAEEDAEREIGAIEDALQERRKA